MSGGSCAATRLTSRLASPGVSNDPNFTAKAADVVGLYVAPPEKAIVLCVDENLRSGSGASAGLSEVAQWPRLDRPEPRLQAAWHDNAVCGARSRHRKIIATHSKRRRRVGFSTSWMASPRLSRTASFTSSSTASTPTKERALAQGHPNVQFHFTPTSASWLNQVGYGSRSCRGSRLAAEPVLNTKLRLRL